LFIQYRTDIDTTTRKASVRAPLVKGPYSHHTITVWTASPKKEPGSVLQARLRETKPSSMSLW